MKTFWATETNSAPPKVWVNMTTAVPTGMSSVGKIGLVKEVAQASLTGQVAQTGYLREFKGADLQKWRESKA